jgi:hypothetical protein
VLSRHRSLLLKLICYRWVMFGNCHSRLHWAKEVNMSELEPTNEVSESAGDGSVGKKLYLKPEVRYERVFETMALACGKVQTTEGQCHANRKNS